MESRCQRFLEILKKIPLFLWSVKSLVLVPWDIYTDVNLAITHFNNGHMVWGGLTVTFLLPSLMFPYHYYHIIKFAVDKFKFLFKSSSPSESEEHYIYVRERWITNLDAILAYFEDIPQFILQVYILWKTPVECFSFDGDWTRDEISAIQSVLTSFLSISATVVPYFKKRELMFYDFHVMSHDQSQNHDFYDADVQEENSFSSKWELMSVKGILSFIAGTFFNVIPKLVLISWTFSVLNWYMWLFFIPLFLISWYIVSKTNDFNFPSNLIGRMKVEEPYVMNRFGLQFITTIQFMFGYSGRRGTLFSAFIMTCFLIPLGISLHAAVNTSEEVDYFAVFPRDPFPSRTICFTNSSLIEQQDMWSNETITFSNNCNMTYSEVLCDQAGHRNIIVVQLALLITMVSLLSGGAFILFLLFI